MSDDTPEPQPEGQLVPPRRRPPVAVALDMAEPPEKSGIKQWLMGEIRRCVSVLSPKRTA